MAVFASLKALVTADASQFRRELRAAAAETEMLKKRASSSFSIGGLKKTFGSESGIGQLGAFVRGGGPLIGATLAAEGFNRVVAKLQDIDQQFGRQAGIKEYFVALVKDLPIVSQVSQGLENFFNGAQIRGAQQWNAEMQVNLETLRAYRDAVDNVRSALVDMRVDLSRTMRLRSATEVEQAIFRATDEEADTIAKVAKELKKARDAADAFAKAQEPLRVTLDNLFGTPGFTKDMFKADLRGLDAIGLGIERAAGKLKTDEIARALGGAIAGAAAAGIEDGVRLGTERLERINAWKDLVRDATQGVLDGIESGMEGFREREAKTAKRDRIQFAQLGEAGDLAGIVAANVAGLQFNQTDETPGILKSILAKVENLDRKLNVV